MRNSCVWPNKRKAILSITCALAMCPTAATENVVPIPPNVEVLRSLEMDAVSEYDDYEELWSRAVAASADDIEGWQALADSVAQQTPDDVWGKCGFRVWTAKDDNSWEEESYAPWREPKWQLHTVEGAQPSEKQQKAYQKGKRKDAKAQEKARRRALRKGEDYSPPLHPVGVGDIPTSFAPNVTIQGRGVRFLGWMPDPSAEEPWRRGAQTTVGLNPAHQIESIDQRSFAPFKAGRGITIEKFQLRSLFRYDGSLQLPVLRFQEHAMTGKALRFISARGHTRRWYDDVRCVD